MFIGATCPVIYKDAGRTHVRTHMRTHKAEGACFHGRRSEVIRFCGIFCRGENPPDRKGQFRPIIHEKNPEPVKETYTEMYMFMSSDLPVWIGAACPGIYEDLGRTHM